MFGFTCKFTASHMLRREREGSADGAADSGPGISETRPGDVGGLTAARAKLPVTAAADAGRVLHHHTPPFRGPVRPGFRGKDDRPRLVGPAVSSSSGFLAINDGLNISVR